MDYRVVLSKKYKVSANLIKEWNHNFDTEEDAAECVARGYLFEDLTSFIYDTDSFETTEIIKIGGKDA